MKKRYDKVMAHLKNHQFKYIIGVLLIALIFATSFSFNRIGSLNDRISELNSSIEELESENENLSDEILDLQNDRDNYKNLYTKSQQEIKNYQDQQTKIDELTKQQTDLQAKYDQLNQENTTLKAENESLKTASAQSSGSGGGGIGSGGGTFFIPGASSNSTDNSGDEMVWIPAHGEKYHSISDCGNMNPDTATQVTKSSAEAMGYGACSNCW